MLEVVVMCDDNGEGLEMILDGRKILVEGGVL